MLLEVDKIYQGTSQINLGTGPGVDTPLVALYPKYVQTENFPSIIFIHLTTAVVILPKKIINHHIPSATINVVTK